MSVKDATTGANDAITDAKTGRYLSLSRILAKKTEALEDFRIYTPCPRISTLPHAENLTFRELAHAPYSRSSHNQRTTAAAKAALREFFLFEHRQFSRNHPPIFLSDDKARARTAEKIHTKIQPNSKVTIKNR